MRPTYQPGDLVVTVNSDLVKPKVGSVVVATPWVAGEELPAIAHRVVAVNEDGTIKTKGDYNPEADAWTDRQEDVDKTVVAHVPMGWILTAMKSPFVIFGGISLFALMLFWPSAKKEEDDADHPAGATPPCEESSSSSASVVDITNTTKV
jgi:signal peptidase I